MKWFSLHDDTGYYPSVTSLIYDNKSQLAKETAYQIRKCFFAFRKRKDIVFIIVCIEYREHKAHVLSKFSRAN